MSNPPDNHHLDQKKSGTWRMRVRIDRGRKFVGKRIYHCLGTSCVQEARVRRDLVMKALEKAEKLGSETTNRLHHHE